MNRIMKWVPWLVLALTVGLYIANVLLSEVAPLTEDERGGYEWLWPLSFLSFGVVGALILTRLPSNKLGWIMCGIPLTVATMVFTGVYSRYALITRNGDLPLGEFASWVAAWVPQVGVILVLQLLILFPTGHATSRFWRAASIAVTVLGGILLVAYAIRPGGIDGAKPLENPWAIESSRAIVGPLIGAIGTTLAGLFVFIVAAKFWSYRKARGIERQQLKWFALSGAFFPLLFAVAIVIEENTRTNIDLVIVGWFFGFTGIAVGIGLAVFKHRLYDIDLIVNKTLVYGLLTGLSASIYFGAVAAVSTFAGDSNLVVAAATLAVAAIFQPLRRRIQEFIDRRFYRRRYDAAHTIERFSRQLRDEIELESLTGELLAVVNDTMQPTRASLWLMRPAARQEGA